MFTFHIKRPVHQWTMMFREFKASYHGSYKYCLEDATEKEELIHFLHFHRWIDPVELRRFFGRASVDNARAKPFSCSPAALKDVVCKCHPNR